MQTVDGWVTHHDVALGYIPANGTIDVDDFPGKGDTTNAQWSMLGYLKVAQHRMPMLQSVMLVL